MKQANVDAEFSHLIAHRNWVSARGRGSTAKAAIHRAIDLILRDPLVRRTHLDDHAFKLTVTVITVADTPEE